MTITVVGSINVDESIYLKEFPEAGETVFSHSTKQYIGGKGFNQAYALHQLGEEVHFIASIGNDANAQLIQNTFQEAQLSTQGLKRVETSSGKAVIMISDSSENRIIVDSGANAQLKPEDLDQHAQVIQASKALVLQLESPSETVIKALELARAKQVTTILNPAPASTTNLRMLTHTDILIPNEGELAFIHRILDKAGYKGAGIQTLFELGIKVVIVTLGSKGAKIYYQNGTTEVVAGQKVKAIDTTAAGDSFVGTFAKYYTQMQDIKVAVEYANLMGALTVQTKGSASSIVNLESFEKYAKEVNNQLN